MEKWHRVEISTFIKNNIPEKQYCPHDYHMAPVSHQWCLNVVSWDVSRVQQCHVEHSSGEATTRKHWGKPWCDNDPLGKVWAQSTGSTLAPSKRQLSHSWPHLYTLLVIPKFTHQQILIGSHEDEQEAPLPKLNLSLRVSDLLS